MTSLGVDKPYTPLMADLLSGPKAPVTKAFLFCGWRCLTVDWLIDPSHDLSNDGRQRSLAEQLQQADFICTCAAMDCSTKSRAREIPRHFDDGRPAPSPFVQLNALRVCLISAPRSMPGSRPITKRVPLYWTRSKPSRNEEADPSGRTLGVVSIGTCHKRLP